MLNSLTVAPSQEKRNTEPAKMEWSVTEVAPRWTIARRWLGHSAQSKEVLGYLFGAKNEKLRPSFMPAITIILAPALV